MRIGYLVPGFPGQTQTWVWRELRALRELGVPLELDLVSTRLPPANVICHGWAEEARSITTYLFPFGVRGGFRALLGILRAGPKRWVRCLSVIAKAEGASVTQRLRLLGLLLAAGRLVQLAQSRSWAHLHVVSCGYAGDLALFANALADLPYSLTLLGPVSDFGPNQPEKWRHASFGIVMSNLLAAELRTTLEGTPLPPLAVAPMGVDVERTRREAPYIPYSGSGMCEIYSCARLNPGKGHDVLLEAFSLLRERGLDAQLRIAGEDEAGGSGYRNELERIIRARSLDAHVDLLGAVAEEQNLRNLEQADVFVLASRSEGISVSAMEAMAMRVPVVATNVGGMHYLVEQNIDGILVPPNDPRALTDALERVLRNPALASRLGKRSRQKVATGFHHRSTAAALAHELGVHPAD